MRRFFDWAIGVAIVQSLVLAVLAWWLDGFEVGGARSLVLTAVLISLLQAGAWPVLYTLATRFHPLLFPFLSFILSGALVLVAVGIEGWIGVNEVNVRDLKTGILVALGFTVGGTLIAAIFSIDDTAAYSDS